MDLSIALPDIARSLALSAARDDMLGKGRRSSIIVFLAKNG